MAITKKPCLAANIISGSLPQDIHKCLWPQEKNVWNKNRRVMLWWMKTNWWSCIDESKMGSHIFFAWNKQIPSSWNCKFSCVVNQRREESGEFEVLVQKSENVCCVQCWLNDSWSSSLIDLLFLGGEKWSLSSICCHNHTQLTGWEV